VVQINLEKAVDYKTLENAILKAAEELGWKAKIIDKIEVDYDLNSPQKIQKYKCTDINLSGKILPAAELTVFNRYNKEASNKFFLYTGLPFGCASQSNINEYLKLVYKNIKV
jgi:hypothetical protein